MSDQSLKDALREHYRQASLRPEALARMRVMARTHPRARLPSRRAIWITLVGGAIAVVALIVGILLPYLNTPPRPGSANDLAPAVISAVQTEHRTARGPEVRAETFQELEYMSASLGFTPAAPERLAGAGYLLVGASRVTLLDAPAVELVLSGPEGNRATLIQTLEARVPVSARREIQRGTHVSLWHEDEFLYALAVTVE